jgi:hypothetical protein
VSAIAHPALAAAAARLRACVAQCGKTLALNTSTNDRADSPHEQLSLATQPDRRRWRTTRPPHQELAAGRAEPASQTASQAEQLPSEGALVFAFAPRLAVGAHPRRLIASESSLLLQVIVVVNSVSTGDDAD